MENEWIEIHADLNASQLVILAIKRIEENSQIFYEFVGMLSDIKGMDIIAEKLLDYKLRL